ncbi:MAG: hypothetical protein HOL48_04915 [Porticoccaceae bacterium]|jgi:hypothetical protein|nr:hypothetical protein [Porticoccaceae bacterium]
MTAELISFKMEKKKRAKNLGLCQHGFHKWEVDQKKQFDPKEGKLVTVYKCSKCPAKKVKAI